MERLWFLFLALPISQQNKWPWVPNSVWVRVSVLHCYIKLLSTSAHKLLPQWVTVRYSKKLKSMLGGSSNLHCCRSELLCSFGVTKEGRAHCRNN